jgi:hypothetical protein
MAHSFVAYIDESGDEGFKFRLEPGLGSSEWFVISAVLAPTSREIAYLKQFHEIIRPIEKARGKPIHFSKLNHEQRVAVCAGMGDSNFRHISISVHKPSLDPANFAAAYRLYFYATRYLLERVSWLARDRAAEFGGDGRVRLVFSNRRRMSYDDLRAYIDRLRADEDVRVHWPAIDTGLVEAREHSQLVGLRAVDVLASGIRYSLELTQYGHCEDRYGRLLEPRTYRHNGRARPYGMKFFPAYPAAEPLRYGWLHELFPK